MFILCCPILQYHRHKATQQVPCGLPNLKPQLCSARVRRVPQQNKYTSQSAQLLGIVRRRLREKKILKS